MPDTGILNLEIRDNSTTAAQGLKELEKALSSVQGALGGGLNLPTKSIKAFATAVSANSKALSNTGTFLNAMKEYHKAFKDVGKVKFDTQPITDLKEALQDGLKIGQAGTQLKNLRDAFTGDWGQVGDTGKEIHSAVSGMQAIKEMADKFQQGSTAKNIKDVAEAITQLTKAQKDMPSGGAHDLYGMFGGAQSIAGQGGMLKMLGKPFSMQTFGGSGSGSPGQMSMFEHTKQEVQEVIDDCRLLNSTVEKQNWPNFGSALYENIKGIMDTPLEHLHDIYRTPTRSMEDYRNAVDVVLPKVQAMSSEEMVLAANAKKANEEIARMISLLNSFGSPKGQALQGIIDVVTGVSRGNAGGGAINASTTMFTPVQEMAQTFSSVQEATEGTIRIFDNASGAYQEMFVHCEKVAESADTVSESVSQMNMNLEDAISLTDMPASGKNGVFANANEEFLYLTGQIEKAKADTKEYFDIAMRAEKQLKFGGPRSKDELQFDYKHGIEGYEQAIATEEKYQESLRGLMTYVQQTASEMRSAIKETHETPVEDAAQKAKDAMDQVGASDGAKEAEKKVASLKLATGEAASKIELLRTKLEELKRSYNDISQTPAAVFGGSDGKASALNNVALQIGRVNEQIDKLVQNSHKATEAANFKQLQDSIVLPQHDNMEMVNNLVNQYSEVDLLTMKMEGMKQALADDITQNKVDTQQIAQRTIAIQQLRDKIEELKNTQEGATEETKKSISGWKVFGKGMQALFPTLTQLVHRFKGMLIMRSMRYIIRQIAAGMSEGIQNVYQYSKAIGSSFAPAMDSAASSLQQMKNSIGAAVAPAIQALIPVMQTVVNWFIQAVNYINQFFALLNGQRTWTRALPATANAFDKQTKAAKGAGAAMKDLLADWDELNIIQSQTGSGGGAGSATKAEDYLKMFEEVSRFDNKVKDVVNFIKDNFGNILKTVLGITAALKLWRLSSAMADVLPTLSKIAMGFSAGATIAISAVLTDLTGKAYMETGDPGWLIADILTGAVGASVAGGIANHIVKGLGPYVAGFTFILEGAVNLINAVEAADQEQEGKAFALASVGALELGIGAGLGAFGLGGAGVAIAAGAVVGIGTLALAIPILMSIKKKASYRKMAYDAFTKAGEDGVSVDAYIKALQGRLNVIASDAQLVIDASVGFGENSEKIKENIDNIYRLNSLLTSGQSFTVAESEEFKTAWHNVFEAMNELSTASFNTIYAGLSEVIASGSDELRKQAEELRKQTIEIAEITGGTRGRVQKKMELLIGTITSENSDPKEVEKAIEEYDKLYRALIDTEDSGVSGLKKVLEQGKGFDFTGEDNPVQAAIDFINQISEQDFNPTIEKVQEAYEAELQAIEQAKRDVELAYKTGDIKPDDYKKFIDTLTGDTKLLEKWMNDKKDEILSMRDKTYEAVINQAWRGYSKVQGDSEVAKQYVDSVINPILDAAEKAGHDVTKWRNRLNEMLVPYDYTELFNTEQLDKAKVEYYRELADFASDSTAQQIRTILGAEIDNGMDLTVGSESAKEFVNTILQLDDLFSYEEAIKGISDATGWSIQEVLDQINVSALDVDQLEALSEAIKTLKAEFDFKNPVSPTDVSDAAERTRKIAESYEDMVRRINNALENLNGAGFSMNISGLAGVVAGIPHKAMGGVVRSGDLVMANENGNFEMMGRMGNQPVIANNQQIVAGISQGVTQANGGVESRLTSIENLLTRVLNKEFVARAVPSASWGAHAVSSADQYDRVTGG